MTTAMILQAAQGGGSYMWVMILIFFAIMYFFMIRPQQKKQKETQRFRSSLAVGQAVITAGGIHGEIKEIKDDTIVLTIDKNVTIVIEKGSIYPSAAAIQQGK